MKLKRIFHKNVQSVNNYAIASNEMQQSDILSNKCVAVNPVKKRCQLPSALSLPAVLQFQVHSCKEHSGSVVECLTGDREAKGLSLKGVTALWSLNKTHLS